MSLFIGKTGRKLVDFSLNHPQSKAVKAANWLSQKVSATPGLTRQTYQLWKTIKAESYYGKIFVRPDGFYSTEKKLAGNGAVAATFFKAKIMEMDAMELAGPEEIANLPREKMFTVGSLLVSLAPSLTFGALSIAPAFSGTSHLNLPAAIFALANSPLCLAADKIVHLFDRYPRPSLLEIEHYKKEEIVFLTGPDKGSWDFVRPDIPNKYFTTGPLDSTPTTFSLSHFHEKAHLLGANEREAYQLMRAYALKRAFASGGKVGILCEIIINLTRNVFHNSIFPLLYYIINYFKRLPPFQLMAWRNDHQKLEDKLKAAKAIIEKSNPPGDSPKDFLRLGENFMRLALIHSALGDSGAAIEALTKAVAAQQRCLTLSKTAVDRISALLRLTNHLVTLASHLCDRGDKTGFAVINEQLNALFNRKLSEDEAKLFLLPHRLISSEKELRAIMVCLAEKMRKQAGGSSTSV